MSDGMNMISYIVNQLRKLNNYYKKSGFCWVCRHIITNLVHYKKMVIFETDIYENSESKKSKIPVNIRMLSNTEEDINRLSEFWPTDTYAPPFSTPQMIRDLIVQRLAVGEVCFVAEHNGQIIYMSWYGFQNAHIFEPYEEKRGLGPGEALSHSAFCAPDYRGNNVVGAAHSMKWNFLLKNKVSIP